ncbi:DUF7269 family protein [Haloarchaeobius sp. DFWS5]|uniref:DUF7269 family protein n=1 Tax=Haloarchaeobius sp. DFWS5 TaxID=3446114 RepID=UPI003EBC634C
MNVPLLDDAARRRQLLYGIGTASFLAAAALAFLPLSLEPLRPYVTGILTNTGTVLFLGLAGGAVGALHLYTTKTNGPIDGGDEDDYATSAQRFGVPEEATYQARESAGANIDDSVEKLTGELPGSRAKNWWQSRERLEVEGAIRTAAIDVLMSSENCSHDEAKAHLDNGTWTDDPRAAAFLGPEAPELPIKMQFYDWLSGEAYERHVTHTVDEIADRAGLLEAEA